MVKAHFVVGEHQNREVWVGSTDAIKNRINTVVVAADAESNLQRASKSARKKRVFANGTNPAGVSKKPITKGLFSKSA